MPESLPSIAQLNEDIGRGLQQDGHSSEEVVRKLTRVHQLPEREARAIASKLFGTTQGVSRSMLTTGLTLTAGGLFAGGLLYAAMGFEPLRVVVPMYVLAFGAFSSGLIAIVRALTKD
jgi:hypothetical protein